MFTIILSAGHSFRDPGACAFGLKESEVNMILRNRVKKHLEDLGTEVLTPPDDLSLSQTVKWCKERLKEHPSIPLILELHMNAAGPLAHGVETFYANGDSDMRILGTQLVTDLCKLMSMLNRGAKPEEQSFRGRLGFLRLPHSLILEMGFLTNTEEATKVLTPEYAQRLAEVVVSVLRRQRESLGDL